MILRLGLILIILSFTILLQGQRTITGVVKSSDNQERTIQDLHFMVVEAVSDTLDPIFIDQELRALEGFRFVSEPTDASSLNFLSGSVESFVTYSVKVYHINEEYVAIYENSNQDSRDLNEPPSNVQNALGVFSAFNSQEVFFEVVRE